MAVWTGAKQGHRIEDYQFNLLDVSYNWLGQITGVHKAKGKRTVYGQYKGYCTFSLPLDNKWAKVLKEDEVHFLQVLRDGTAVFEGYQVVLKRTDDGADTKQWAEFSFVPLARLLYWRFGKVITGSALSVSAKVDDAMKWVVERTAGPTAPVSGTSSTVRAYTGLSVAANKTEHPTTITYDATLRNIYESLQWYGTAYSVDWDVYFTAALAMVFETWYPRRGADKTEDTAAPIIWTDDVVGISGQDYGWDSSDQVTLVHDAVMAADVVAAAGVRSKWLVKELVIGTADTTEMQVVLNDKALRTWYLLRNFRESQDNQWGTHWVVGDLITWKSNRMAYGPHDDLISEVEWTIDEDGWETLIPTLGEPELKTEDRLRGGGTGRNIIPYVAKKVVMLEDDANTIVTEDAEGVIMLRTPDDSMVITSDPTFHRLNFYSPWILGSGEVYSRVANDDVVPNGGTGTIGQTTDVWDAGYFEKVGPTATEYMDLYGAGRLGFDAGTDFVFNAAGTLSLIVTATAVRPSPDGTITSGAASNRWANVYSVDGNYTGDVTIGTLKGIIHADSVAAGKYLRADGTRFVPGDIAASDITGLSDPGTCSVSTSNAAGTPHTHAITATADPGAATSLVKTDASGYMRLARVGPTATEYMDLYGAGRLGFDAGTDFVFNAAGTMSLVATATAVRPSPNGTITSGAASNRWANVYSVDGNYTGDITIGAGKGLIYSVVTAGKVLISNGTRYVPADLSSISGHAILSATHTDSTAADVSRGSLIVGSVSSKWSELVVGAAFRHLESDGVDVTWKADLTLGSTFGIIHADSVAAGKYLRADGTRFVPGDIAAGDITGLSDPGTCSVSTGNAAGTPHTHAITSSSDPGAAASLLASDASGYLQLKRLELDAATEYIYLRAAGQLGLASGTTIAFTSGGVVSLVTSATAVRPSTNGTITSGAASNRWSNVYSVLGNYTGTITASSTGTSIACSGDITMAASKTVDGVDISVFKSAYDAHTHTITGNTGLYTPSANNIVVNAATPVGGATPCYVWCYLDGEGSGDATWRLVYGRSDTHSHAGVGTLATLAP